MVPYSDFNYFIFFSFAFFPIFIITIIWKPNKTLNLLFSLSIIFILFVRLEIASPLLFFILFIVYEYSLIYIIRFLKEKKNQTYLPFIILLAIIPIFFVKIYPVFISNNNYLKQHIPFINHHALIGFLGISYVTFRSIQVLIDINDGLIAKINLFDYLYFVSFFPTITSGPIDRFQRFMKDVNEPFNRSEYLSQLKYGLYRISQGFLYKFIIAFLIKKYWLDIDLQNANLVLTFFSQMYSYSFYLFFDFAGYSSFAIGTSYLIGIKTPENFNKPFMSKNILDFWNKWHISLPTWFRDYIFMRIVLSIRRKKIITNKKLISSIGFLGSFGLMGLWHGIQLNYIVYGFYHGTVCAVHELYGKKDVRHNPSNNYQKFILFRKYFITFHIVCFSFWIFSGLGFH